MALHLELGILRKGWIMCQETREKLVVPQFKVEAVRRHLAK